MVICSFVFTCFYITRSYCCSSASISVISIRRYLQKNIQNLRVILTCLVWADILMSLLKLNLKIICIISKDWWKEQEVLNVISWLQWKLATVSRGRLSDGFTDCLIVTCLHTCPTLLCFYTSPPSCQKSCSVSLTEFDCLTTSCLVLFALLASYLLCLTACVCTYTCFSHANGCSRWQVQSCNERFYRTLWSPVKNYIHPYYFHRNYEGQ